MYYHYYIVSVNCFIWPVSGMAMIPENRIIPAQFTSDLASWPFPRLTTVSEMTEQVDDGIIKKLALDLRWLPLLTTAQSVPFALLHFTQREQKGSQSFRGQRER